MIPLDELELVPQEIVDQRSATIKWQEATAGYYWFLPAILGIVLLANYLNMLPGVLLAVAIGAIITMVTGEGVFIETYSGDLLNPGVTTMVGGVIGAFIGGLIDKKRPVSRKKHRWSFVLMFIGLIIGLLLELGLLSLAAFLSP
jgi:hypothetical protein